MTYIDKFKQDILDKRSVIISVLQENGIFSEPSFEVLAILQQLNNKLYVDILSAMYGEEFSEWYNTAHADGEGAQRVIDSVSGFFATLMSPLTGLNDALGKIGGNEVNTQTLEALNNALYEYEEKIQACRTLAIIGIAVCLIVGLILIFK